MALRFSCKNAAVAQAGTTFAHLITNPSTGAADTPDEWAFNHRGAPPAAASQACTLYMSTAPGTTSFILASSSGATTADVFAYSNHSLVE